MSKRKAVVEPSEKSDVAELRGKLGLSVQEFALKVGVREYTVERWERGESKPSPLARRMIATLLPHDGKAAEGVKKTRK